MEELQNVKLSLFNILFREEDIKGISLCKLIIYFIITLKTIQVKIINKYKYLNIFDELKYFDICFSYQDL